MTKRKWVVVVLMMAMVAGCRARPPSEVVADRGTYLYQVHCTNCHGVKGDGQGPLAKYLWPKPRDFTSGIFKYRTTHGPIPDDTDLLQTMKVGIPGTSMPGWDMLNAQDWKAILTHVKHFIPRLGEGAAGTRIDLPDPPAQSAAAVEGGRVLFTSVGCVACHGANGRGDGPAATTLKDAWGDQTTPRDLAHGPLKWGNHEKEVYRTLLVGIPGTPMPSYERTLTPAQLWQLVAYIKSLQKMPEDYNPSNPQRFLIQATKVDSELPLDPNAPIWQQGKGVPVFLHQLWANNTAAEWLIVRAFHNAKDIALDLRWSDAQPDTRARASDAVAIQWPVHNITDPSQLPFVGMGGADNPVGIWEWKPAGMMEWESKGVGVLTARLPAETKVSGTGLHANGEWHVIVKAPLAGFHTNYLSFAVWDAEAPHLAQPKSFSEWMNIVVE